jgi:hypothetical protein
MPRPIVCLFVLAWFVGGLSGCNSGPQTCSQPLSKSYCAASFEAQVGKPRFCGGSCCAPAGSCGKFKVWRSPPSLSSQICIYDSAGQVLLAALECSDTAAYCVSSAMCIHAGAAIDTDMECDVSMLPKRCAADAGTSD